MSHWASLTLLQAVDVLRVHAQQQAFVVEHADEVVDVVGPVASRIQSLGQGEEWQWVVGEEVDVEDGLWVGNIVLLQVSVQARSWSPEQRRNNEKKFTYREGDAQRCQPEVRDPAGCADSRSGHHHHILAATQLHQPGYRCQTPAGSP